MDVHHRSTTFCIQDGSGKQLLLARCPTTFEGFRERLGPWLREHPQSPVALESGGKAYLVCGIVEALGGVPRVFAADEVRAKARSQKKKSDERDAQDLAQNLRTGALTRQVKMPPKAMRELRIVLKARQLYIKQRTQAILAAKALLREYGVGDPEKNLHCAKAWEEVLAQRLPPLVHELLEEHYRAFMSADGAVKRLTEKALWLGEQAPAFAVAESVPGIGPIVRLALAAHLFDVARFPSGKHAASYAGVVPSMYDTGDTKRHGRITREGPKHLRTLLVEAAQHARLPTSPLYPFYAPLAARRGHKKAVVALANKLCRIIFAMVREQKGFDLERLGVLKKPLVTTRTRVYRLKRTRTRAA
jgi:transposase